jgi:NAD(P)-dependent dehydrogenase (short-subunit alcohol dehydrogenase family)
MQVDGRVAVVTGGASGIGRALCLAIAAHGAAGVVVADIDADGARAVAAELGDLAIALRCDVSHEPDVQDLVARTQAEFGRIDLFCSNAGIIVAGGPEVTDEAWQRIWAINVHSHVFVARAVLPAMLERGAGHLVITASAAGLLTQLGSAPYAVTKHAAVAFAEWLSITYGDRGISVSCLCPQAVATNMFAGGSGGAQQAAVDGVLPPGQVAECVLEALADGRFLILPHPEVATYEQRRAQDRERWLRGMRRLQARLTGDGYS